MTELLEKLDDAASLADGHDYIRVVKRAVADELHQIDSDLHLEDTHYFNHTAIPDFVATWHGEKATRPVFIRGSYASIVAADELGRLDGEDPVLLALSSEQNYPAEVDPIGPEQIERTARLGRHTLLTDARAVANLANSNTDMPDSSPLTRLIKANFTRGGRGLIDTSRARELVSAGTADSPQTLDQLVAESFFEDAAVRMRRTAQIIELSRGTTWDDQPEIGGRLSAAELSQLIPWLMRNSVRTDTRFWQYIGSLMTFEDLESIVPALSDVDVTPLVVPNAKKWVAKRAQVGFTVASESDDRPGRWKVHGKTIGANVFNIRLMISTDGRSLKGRTSGPLPLWESVAARLGAGRLHAVILKGIERSLTISAESSLDVRADVSSIAASIADRYYVSELVTRMTNPDNQDVLVTVDFAKGIVWSDSPISIDDLVTTAGGVLSAEMHESGEWSTALVWSE